MLPGARGDNDDRAQRRDESPARYAIDARRTFYKEADLQRKGTGKARRHSWGWW